MRTCALPTWAAGDAWPWRSTARPACVVFRAPTAPPRRSTIYVCGTPEPVRTLTLPAP